MGSDLIDKLTSREREILAYIGEGESLAEIAKKLSRSLKTIESHRLSIGRKLRASNRVELAKIAITSGLVMLDAVGIEPGGIRQTRSQAWISEINQAIQQATGRELIKRFCVAVSKLEGVDIAAICTQDPGENGPQCDVYSRVIMAASDSGRLVKPIRYNAMQTPCQVIIEQGSLMMSEGVLKRFPNDPWLKAVEAEGYLGLILKNAAGNAVGGVGIISRDVIDDIDALRQVIDFFNPWLARALQGCAEIESLRSENDRLQAGLIELRAESEGQVETAGVRSDAFSNISKRVHQLAGTAFLRGFIEALCSEYDLFAGGVCAFDPSYMNQTLHPVSFCLDSKQQDTVIYEAKGTPCEFVLKNASLCLRDEASQAYPADIFFEQNQIRGFCGNRLPSPSGEIAGVIWVASQAPLPKAEEIASLLKSYAPRIGAELNNFMQLDLLMQERERLEAQLARQSRPPA